MTRSRLAPVLLAVGACAACCAPLIAPPLIGLLAAGGATLAVVGQVGLAVLVAGAGIGYAWWLHARRAAAARARAEPTATACGCAPEAGCTADSCALPPATPTQ